MARSKIKATNKTAAPQVISSVQSNNEINNTSTTQAQNQLMTTPVISINEIQQSPTIESNAFINNNINTTNSPNIQTVNQSINLTPTINSNMSSSINNHQTSPLSSNINIVNNNNNISNQLVSPMLSNSLSSSALSSNVQNSLNQHQHNSGGMSTSISTQSIHMLSASLSTEKLAQIQINTSASLLDSEEIGHGIPTPECLPQSRKHSIVQSKLATPRLSSS